MLSDKEIDQYLSRIKHSAALYPDLATLTTLHQAHMRYIPFENLDIHLGIPIELSHSALFNKIISEKRGGFCYELNYLFCALLSSIGFSTQLISAKVFNGKSYGPEFDHLLLLITLNNTRYIADVGFGDSFQTPLTLDAPKEKHAVYQIIQSSDMTYTVVQKKGNQSEQPQFQFTLKTYDIADFSEMCIYQQTSPASQFTQKSLCSMATPEGRNTISNGCVIQTQNSHRTIHHIGNATEYRQLLLQYFQITLPENANIAALFPKKMLAKQTLNPLDSYFKV